MSRSMFEAKLKKACKTLVKHMFFMKGVDFQLENHRFCMVSCDQVVAPHHHMIQDPQWYLVISGGARDATGGHGTESN